MIYLDSAALVKLVRVESETRDLIEWLNARSDQRLVASVLVEIEVLRALRRSGPSVLGAVAPVLAKVDRVEISPAVRAVAGAYPEPRLRSLDAIHLATAEVLIASDLKIDVFVTYDRKLLEAADRTGLATAAPGQQS